MDTFSKNINQICNKLKKIRGDKSRNVEISSIETLNGTFSGNNVLEGFCSNTETLCNDDSDFDHGFYKMCSQDNMIILDIASQKKPYSTHVIGGSERYYL